MERIKKDERKLIKGKKMLFIHYLIELTIPFMKSYELSYF